MVGKKRKQIHHNYDEQHIRFVLAQLSNNIPYKKLQVNFNDAFGWTIPLGTLSKIKTGELNKVKQQVDNNRKGSDSALIQSETQVKRTMDTNQIRIAFVDRILPLINKSEDEDGEQLSDGEVMERIRQLANPLLKALDGIDNAGKVLPPSNQFNFINFNFNELSDDQMETLLMQFAQRLCSKCRWKREVVDV
jgi:hypothetical protein